jgi:hypothetical protein
MALQLTRAAQFDGHPQQTIAPGESALFYYPVR